MLWDLAEGKRLYSLDAGDIIYALTFSPNRYWLCAATQTCIKIWCAGRFMVLVNHALQPTCSAHIANWLCLAGLLLGMLTCWVGAGCGHHVVMRYQDPSFWQYPKGFPARVAP